MVQHSNLRESSIVQRFCCYDTQAPVIFQAGLDRENGNCDHTTAVGISVDTFLFILVLLLFLEVSKISKNICILLLLYCLLQAPHSLGLLKQMDFLMPLRWSC